MLSRGLEVEWALNLQLVSKYNRRYIGKIWRHEV
jgi:hypothetical protein